MISNRLITIAKNCLQYPYDLADIGSDHGFLLLYLRENGFSYNLLGVENKKGPFNALKEHIANSNYKDSISLSFSDGLEDVNSNYKMIVMAGIGFDTIKSIVNKDISKLSSIDVFIIDSHTKVEETRRFFSQNGYKISKESIIFEDGIYYEIISFEKGIASYSDEEYRYGPILMKERSGIFIQKYIEKQKCLLNLLDRVNKNSKKYQDLEKEISELNSLLDL